MPPKRRDVAMVFQSYALYPYMTVAKNLSLPLEMRRPTAMARLPLVGRWLPGAGTRSCSWRLPSTSLPTTSGRHAIAVLRNLSMYGKMSDIQPEVMFPDFFAGRMGISMQSTAQLGCYNREMGGRFPLTCARHPLNAAKPHLRAGGNVTMIFAKGAAKQDAAWKFLKFACGPQGATMTVKATGYMPATSIPPC